MRTYFHSSTAVQKKSLRSTGKLSSSKNVQAQNATCEVKEDTDFIEITDGPVSEADAQVPETVSVSSHTDEMAEAVLDADPSIPSKENEAGTSNLLREINLVLK